MSIRLGVVMDPIESIHYKKDSTLAMLFEAQRRGYEIIYFLQHDLVLRDHHVYGVGCPLKVFRDEKKWFEKGEQAEFELASLDVILMRKDPPFNQEYIYTTYLLELAEREGVLVINKPQGLRDANEKLFIAYFPQCAPPTVVTQSHTHLQAFWAQYGDIVCKPLHTMGGKFVFRLRPNDVNANVIFDTLTNGGTSFVMAQQFIPEIVQGDKRILIIDGKPFSHALVRIPQGKDWRGNLAVGAKGQVKPLTKRDYFICDALSERLREHGLYFVGIDVIGDYLTEINVTSPTGIRELEDGLQTNVSTLLFDCIEQRVKLSKMR